MHINRAQMFTLPIIILTILLAAEVGYNTAKAGEPKVGNYAIGPGLLAMAIVLILVLWHTAIIKG